MTEKTPLSTQRELQFKHGRAVGTSQRRHKAQYCSILTPAGIVGCGIYDLQTAAEFGMAIAIARGTPANPLVEPEDLLEARIVGLTPKAASFGIQVSMTGREAVERMLQAGSVGVTPSGGSGDRLKAELQPGIRVKAIDHVTMVVKDLERSRKFYVDVLGMRQVPRPAFSFEGLWFQAGKTQVHLILEFARSAPAGNLLEPSKRSSTSQHTAFEVDDAHATLAFLKERNVAVVDGPKLRPDGYVQIFVTDPDGHVIELCSASRS